jgi:hypothetical protein
MENFDTKKLRKLTINVGKNFEKFGFSRSFTISEPKDKVNYNFLGGGGQISEGGHIT